MTSARIQPFCRNYNINISSFDGTRINPRNNTQTNKTLFKHNNHFCLIWKSNTISFTQVLEDDSKPKFEVVDDVISDKHVKTFIKYDHKT